MLWARPPVLGEQDHVANALKKDITGDISLLFNIVVKVLFTGLKPIGVGIVFAET